jgi:predicted acyl esterase
MTMRALRGVALLLVTLIVGLSLGQGRAAAAPTSPSAAHAITRTTLSVPVVDGPSNDHHVSLEADLYLPDNATPRTPQPAVLMTHGFALSKDSLEMTVSASYFARHGYVVLVYSSQGFGHSGGCVEFDSADYDVKDAMQMVDVLAGRPEVLRSGRLPDGRPDPVVGMVGGSYGGAIDLLTAEFDQRVRAIAPSRTWNALQYSLIPNHLTSGLDLERIPPGVVKAEWTTLLLLAGVAQPLAGHGGCTTTPLDLACPGFDPGVCQLYLSLTLTGIAEPAAIDLLRRSSPATWIDQLRVPTLLMQGQSDTLFNLNEAAATFLSLRRRGVPVRMIWNWGGHGGYGSKPGEGDIYAGDTTSPDGDFLPQQELLWMDRWLRGAAVSTGPAFQYFRDWVSYDPGGSAAPAYGSAPTFPFETMETLRLSGGSATGGGTLVPGVPLPGTARMVNPALGLPASYTETSGLQAPGATTPIGNLPSPFTGIAPFDPPGESVAFTSAPLRRDVVSVGIPTAHLHVTNVNRQDLILYGKLYDVAPDGSATLIHRLIAPVRVPFGLAGTVDMTLDGIAHLFPRGDAVRFEVAATDLTSLNSRLPDTITLAQGGVDPASFSLPIDPGPAPL